MTRSALVPLACLAVLVLPASPALAGAPKRPALRVSACTTGPQAADRVAVFRASISQIRGADRLWMRFELQRRADAGATWARGAAPLYGNWLRSRPGVAGFVHSRRVVGLDAPAQYRTVVHFRWVSASGETIRRALRTSAVCRQPDPRPNLAIVDARPVLAAGESRIAVTVRNHGRGATRASVPLLLRIGGVQQPPRSVSALAAGETAVIEFAATRCEPGVLLDAVADPSDELDEARETDNRLVHVC